MNSRQSYSCQEDGIVYKIKIVQFQVQSVVHCVATYHGMHFFKYDNIKPIFRNSISVRTF